MRRLAAWAESVVDYRVLERVQEATGLSDVEAQDRVRVAMGYWGGERGRDTPRPHRNPHPVSDLHIRQPRRLPNPLKRATINHTLSPRRCLCTYPSALIQKWALPVLDEATGQTLDYRQLRQHPDFHKV